MSNTALQRLGVWGSSIGVLLLGLLFVSGCREVHRNPGTLVFMIQSSPANLDPRIGTDEASEHIDELLFDGLVDRDAHYRFTPALATSWSQPDPLTLIFYLRAGVRFSNGKRLTARDVVWSIDSMRDGTVISPKAAAYKSVESVQAAGPLTVVFHLKHPDNFLMTNLSTGAFGVVPYGAGKNFWRDPVGTGPFKFVSQRIDQDVLIERNSYSWSVKPKIAQIRFAVVPDAITMALELEKGSADVESNSLPMDVLPVLAKRRNLVVDDAPGTNIQYLAFNTRDPILRHMRVRQAIACAINRKLIIHTLWGGRAHPAESLLPPNHWAWTSSVARYAYDPKRADRLLDEAGYPRGPDGVRFHLTMKTSNDQQTRLLAVVLQQELAKVGIALNLRSYEFATFYSDVTRGAFQMYSLKWVGGNEQPSIYNYVFSTASFPPDGANRARYSNPRVDALLKDAAESENMARRRADYVEVQQILAQDLPSVNLWYLDTIVVHDKRLTDVIPSPSGDYRFLKTARLASH